MKTIAEKAKKIKAVIFDIDGVMTDGKVIYEHDTKGTEEDGKPREIKNFNVKDGFIAVQMVKMGFVVGAITGRNSPVVKHRCEELKLSFHYHGSKRKVEHYEQIKKDYNLRDEEIAYLGDDIPDLGVLTKCGFSVCPADAREYMKDRVDFVSSYKGGEGVLREVGDLILKEQGKFSQLLDQYINE